MTLEIDPYTREEINLDKISCSVQHQYNQNCSKYSLPLKMCLSLSASCLDPGYYSITREAFTRAYRLVIISLKEADVSGHMFP